MLRTYYDDLVIYTRRCGDNLSFEKPITIKDAIEKIRKKDYYLPAIQREFVWKPDQIEVLFDSLMRDYPIGSFLFWSVDKKNVSDYQFYEFIRDYHEKNTTRNPKANVTGQENITAILDGQQRLTALFLGLNGTYAYKIPYKRWDNDAAFPKRKLFIDLLNESKEYDRKFDFKFLTEDEAIQNIGEKYWFEVGKVLDLKEPVEVNDYLIENELSSIEREKALFANRTLFKLQKIIHDVECINYYLEMDEKLDKVLNIFIRVNSGGTELSYSDLLLSIATAQWQEKDAREEITTFVDEINRIGDGFNFNKDFVLKSCLVLCDFKEIAFKVDNFNRPNMLRIEENWDNVSQAIRISVNLISDLGYNRERLTSTNALIPISYFILKKGNPHNFTKHSQFVHDRKKIHKWLAASLVKRTFSGQPDNVLRPTRSILEMNNENFPFNQIVNRFKGTNKSITFDNDDIENLFFYKHGQSYTYSLLAMLYPTLDYSNKFHIDHIHPRATFKNKKLINLAIPKEDIEFYMAEYNQIANLQLLEGIPNIEKSDSDFKEWLFHTYPDEYARKDFMRKHYIPDIDLSINNFENFITQRKQLMKEEFVRILNPVVE